MRSHVLLASVDRVVKSLQVLGEEEQFSLGQAAIGGVSPSNLWTSGDDSGQGAALAGGFQSLFMQ
jgi:hypothetical protein